MNLSFRFKIQAAVLIILAIVVSLYVFLATSWYKDEKKMAVYETMSLKNSLSTTELTQTINTLISDAKQIIAVYNADQNSAEQLFNNNDQIVGLFVSKDESDVISFNKKKDTSPLFHKPRPLTAQKKLSENSIALYDISSDFLQFQKKEIDASGYSILITITFAQVVLSKNLPSDSLIQSYIANMDNHILSSNTQELELGEQAIKKVAAEKIDILKEMKINNRDYILAVNSFPNLPLKIISIIDKQSALAPLRVLLKKSLFFFIFVLGLTGFFSLMIGISLTQKLILLTEQTKKIAEGDLEVISEIKSNDEIGQLSKSIATMASSLKTYIHELVAKSRMESELKTARAVQDTLFPHSKSHFGPIELTGFYESASETGGDWWFSWKTTEHLYFLIADATGHGAPAALITSAARSCIALVEKNKVSDLVQIADALNHVIRETSKGQILMTALICKLNLENLKIEYVNCSHEPGLIFKSDSEEIKTFFEPICQRLGDTTNTPFSSGSLSLHDGDHVILYTDGFSEVENQEGQRLSERRIHKIILDLFLNEPDAHVAIQKLSQKLKDFTQQPMNDDMTMVHLKVKWDTPYSDLNT